MSHQAHFLGYNEQALNLAQAAQRRAEGHATPTGMALFHAMEARACQRPSCGPRWWPAESPHSSRLISWVGVHLLGLGPASSGRSRRR
jgi:hypothetical protein